MGQFQSSDLVPRIGEILHQTGLAPSCLELEITEREVMEDVEYAIDVLEHVKKLGIKVALDDFGTGYSSLSLLQDLPVHMLKIDRSFVQGVAAEGGRAPFVRAIIELAQGLELTVVAEGIEAIGHVAALRKLGCRVGQGFYFAKPLAPAALEAFVREYRGRSAA